MQFSNVYKDFLEKNSIPGVLFEHNDFVLVISDKYAGEKGSLVNILELKPEPKYILELGSGFDVKFFSQKSKKSRKFTMPMILFGAIAPLVVDLLKNYR